MDAECLEPFEVDQIVRRFGSAVRTFNEQYRIYQYLVKRDYGPIPHSQYEDPEVREAVESRSAYLEAKGLYNLEIYFAVLHEGLRRDSTLRTRLAAFARNPAAALRCWLAEIRRQAHHSIHKNIAQGRAPACPHCHAAIFCKSRDRLPLQ